MDPTDPDFIRVLQDLTGQKELWEDFDPLTLLVPHEDGDSELASQDGSLGPPAECDDWNPNPNVRIRSAEEWAKEPESGSIECLHVVDDGTGALPIEERVKSLAISSATAEEKPIPQRDVSRLMKVKWPQTRLEECQVSKEGDEFCPWKLVTKYLGMYVGKQNAKRVSLENRNCDRGRGKWATLPVRCQRVEGKLLHGSEHRIQLCFDTSQMHNLRAQEYRRPAFHLQQAGYGYWAVSISWPTPWECFTYARHLRTGRVHLRLGR